MGRLQLVLSEKKIILGSFPTWTLSDSHNGNIDENNNKKVEREAKGDFDFYFGSSTNCFWDWYCNFVDSKIDRKDQNSISSSLKMNLIGITDMIISCERKGKSSLDKHLKNRQYNYGFFNYPQVGETIKILCTSKGLMNEMLLSRKFLSIHSELKECYIQSNRLQNEMLNKFKGDKLKIKNPLVRVFYLEKGGLIECVAIPSPGSPYRRLCDFGLNKLSPKEFLNSYLESVFGWFNN